MGRTMPTECEHGKILDWGDFGGPDSTPQDCDECERKRQLMAIVNEARIRYRVALDMLKDL